MKALTEAEIRSKSKISCVEAASYLGIPPNHLRVALEQNRIPIGECVRGPKGRRIIHINKDALIKYKNGDMTLVMIAQLQARVAELEKQSKGA